jgi:hypothetical protein
MMKTVFIRAIEAPVDEKAAVIRAAVRASAPFRFSADPRSFLAVPQAPFAYWISDGVRSAFVRFPVLEVAGRVARRGVNTNDDLRFLRLAWESSGEAWKPHAKGGAFAKYYSDINVLLRWGYRELVADRVNTRTYKYAIVPSRELYFRPGLTWSRRTTSSVSFRAMPAGCIFGDKGPAVFDGESDSDSLLALLAIVNSSAFGACVSVQLGAADAAARSYEVGLIQQTPVPALEVEDIAELARRSVRIWSIKRRLDTRTENSHAFLLPALLQADGNSLIDRAQAWGRLTAAAEVELDVIAAEIDDHAYRLYRISVEDRQRIENGFVASDDLQESTEENDEDDNDGEAADVDVAPTVSSLLSWSVGVVFGRFDARLATNERAAPPEPEPFDPLPVCSSGMLTGDDGLPLTTPPVGYPLTFPMDGILVDDPGHPRDFVSAVRSVFDLVFDDANARWHEAAELLGTPDLRSWFAHAFFDEHIKRYSKSRRKAPIYWQLATASGSYSVWVYVHRATGDTLFRVLNEFVGPKLDHEKAKLDELSQEAGASPSATQRRELERQENFVGELHALNAEVARVAPLWKPNLDDGAILNCAPLWRLVPQNRSWQGECKKAWDKLQSGEYDWAHLAMHLWPERVVLKCIEDRSLAIAHGLEDKIWHEDESGVWCKRRIDDATIQRLVNERTSTSVKAALRSLLSAATPASSKGRKARGRSASPRGAAPMPVPAAAGAAIAEVTVDDATLSVVKAAIAGVADGASKADVLAATGISDADWNKAIAALLDRGDVTRTGQKRGTRYHADSQGEGG